MITDTPFEQKWVLQGRLCGVWALDLQEKWLSTKSTREGASARSISKTLSPSGREMGERVLLQMATEGGLSAPAGPT